MVLEPGNYLLSITKPGIIIQTDNFLYETSATPMINNYSMDLSNPYNIQLGQLLHQYVQPLQLPVVIPVERSFTFSKLDAQYDKYIEDLSKNNIYGMPITSLMSAQMYTTPSLIIIIVIFIILACCCFKRLKSNHESRSYIQIQPQTLVPLPRSPIHTHTSSTYMPALPLPSPTSSHNVSRIVVP